MKFSEKFKEFQAKRTTQKKESRAFKSIVEERAQVTRRQAYAKESGVQARAEGRRLAQRQAERRANPMGKRMLSGLVSFAEQSKPAPVRRAPVRRRSPAKRAATRRAPVRRSARKRAPIRRAPAQKPLLPMKEYFG